MKKTSCLRKLLEGEGFDVRIALVSDDAERSDEAGSALCKVRKNKIAHFVKIGPNLASGEGRAYRTRR